MTQYIAGVGQGTTGTRFIVFDHVASVVIVERKEHQPRANWEGKRVASRNGRRCMKEVILRLEEGSYSHV